MADRIMEALTIPGTLREALDPAWLTTALSSLTDGAPVTGVEIRETAGSVATSSRFVAHWQGGRADLCLKSFFDNPVAHGQKVRSDRRITEFRFYQHIAPHLRTLVPETVCTMVDDVGLHGLVIMRDLLAQGARFGSALDPLAPDDVAKSLEQIAHIHAGAHLLEGQDWINHVVSEFTSWNVVPPDRLQELLDGPRGRNLAAGSRNAGRLIDAVDALAVHDARLPATLLHGDCHAGNFYWTADGPGLADWQTLQRGGWAIDVAYHIGAVLPVDIAANEEWALLDHYLGFARAIGNDVPDRETARRQYRMAMIYGYYMWAITTKPPRPVIETFVDRLGQSVERLGSFALVGI